MHKVDCFNSRKWTTKPEHVQKNVRKEKIWLHRYIYHVTIIKVGFNPNQLIKPLFLHTVSDQELDMWLYRKPVV